MHPLDVIRTALAEIRANKLRCFFTLLGIIVSVAFLVAVVAIIQGMNAYVKENVANAMIGANAFQVRRTPIQIGLFDDEAYKRLAAPARDHARRREAVRAALPDAAAVALSSGLADAAARTSSGVTRDVGDVAHLRRHRAVSGRAGLSHRARPAAHRHRRASSDAPWSCSAPRWPTSCSRKQIPSAKRSDSGASGSRSSA